VSATVPADGLVLRLRSEPAFRLDLSQLTPEKLSGQGADAVARLPLSHGRLRMTVGDWFDVRGHGGARLVIEADGARLDRIGAAMTDGELRVDGDAGAYLGIDMRGGRIAVSGDADAYVACSMAGGSVSIGGSAGDFLGAALPGEHKGMRGGTVIVAGSIGDRAGDHMRRGLVLVEGDAGSYCGARMQGGTIGLLGRAGPRPGYAMRRGTLMFTGAAPTPGPSFNDAGELPLGFLVLMLKSWRNLPSRFASLQRPSTRVRRWIGDLGFGGQGELIHWPD
jgi:formylmethanofuran dehydrogenase subunit C